MMRVVGGSRALEVIFRSYRYDEPDQADYTFTGIDFGPDTLDRILIVGITEFSSSANPSSVVINGITATLIKRDTTNPGGRLTLWAASVEGPTSGTVQVFSSKLLGCGCAVWSMAGGLGNVAPYDTDSFISGSRDYISLNVPEGGAVVAMSMTGASSTVFDSGTVSNDYFDANLSLGGQASSLAEDVDYRVTTTPDQAIMIGASWG